MLSVTNDGRLGRSISRQVITEGIICHAKELKTLEPMKGLKQGSDVDILLLRGRQVYHCTWMIQKTSWEATVLVQARLRAELR